MGQAISLRTLSKAELLGTKLIGLGDRSGRDEEDIVGMKPTRKELTEAYDWANHLTRRLAPILRKLGYEL